MVFEELEVLVGFFHMSLGFQQLVHLLLKILGRLVDGVELLSVELPTIAGGVRTSAGIRKYGSKRFHNFPLLHNVNDLLCGSVRVDAERDTAP